jgi:hypothetical protein
MDGLDQRNCSPAICLVLQFLWYCLRYGSNAIDKNEFGKVILVGLGSRACHMLLYFVYFNWILVSGGNGRAIEIV